jgi:hypothetical protein
VVDGFVKAFDTLREFRRGFSGSGKIPFCWSGKSGVRAQDARGTIAPKYVPARRHRTLAPQRVTLA